MATHLNPARRMILAGGFIVAISAAPAVAAFAAPAAGGSAPTVSACDGGESNDLFTGNCTPDLVPNSPAPASAFGETSPGGLPEIDGVPCAGAGSGNCIGLAEEAQSEGPAAIPDSTVDADPTITGFNP